jgi:hypothetical protein
VFYDEHMSGASNAVIVPKVLPAWELPRQRELWEAKEALYRERSAQ